MTVSNYFKHTNIQITILTSLWHFWWSWSLAASVPWPMAYGTFGGVGVCCKCSLALVTKWRVDIPLYVKFTSREHVNLYTTLDFKATEVLDFRSKYDPVFSKVQLVKIRTLNLCFSKVDNWDANLRDGFPKFGKPSMYA